MSHLCFVQIDVTFERSSLGRQSLWNMHNSHLHLPLQLNYKSCYRISVSICSFWNFDALFQPQQHNAHDSHDTFFLEGMVQLTEWLTHAFSTILLILIWSNHLQLHPLQGNYLNIMLSWWSVFMSLVVMAPGGMMFFFFW